MAILAPSKEKLLSLCGGAEKLSEHPLGQAIVEYCENKNIHLVYINYTDFNIFTLQDIYKPELIK